MRGDPKRKTKPLFVVEDDPDQQELLKLMLDRVCLPSQVVCFSTGEKLMEHMNKLVSKQGLSDEEIPTLITLDLRLPGVDGLEVLQVIRSHDKFSKVPVLVLTASQLADDVKASYRLGGTVFLRKPFEEEELKNILQQLRIMGLLKG
ncbi:MAG: response regulator [Candidatus Omnitrophica bacterium]|nr:response regulator [Candidatus Omnitrophota bacterium]